MLECDKCMDKKERLVGVNEFGHADRGGKDSLKWDSQGKPHQEGEK